MRFQLGHSQTMNVIGSPHTESSNTHPYVTFACCNEYQLFLYMLYLVLKYLQPFAYFQKELI